MATSAGTKVTDPHNTKPESVGVVTSDSLAAESLKGSSTGHFGAGNPQAAASKQPSHSTTTNTTDTSGATRLPPAADADTREAQQGWTEAQQLQAGQGLGKESGNSGSAGGVTGGYAGASETVQDAGVKKPHGKNLTEVQDLEGKRVFGEVGTEQDPSRAAEQKLAQRTAHPGGDAGSAGSKLQDGGSKFSGLGDESV